MEKDNKFQIINYKITEDKHFIESINPLPPEIKDQIEYLHDLALTGKKSSVKTFLELINKYPHVPVLKYYLSLLYSNMGKLKKAFKVNKRIVSEHPDYLFGRTNLAMEYLLNEKYDKIPEVLGESMELKSLYPERDTFHIKEVSDFYKTAVLYFCTIEDFEQAEKRLEILRQVAPDSLEREIAEETFEITKSAKWILSQGNYTVEVKPTVLTNKTAAPKFTHPEIKLLYKNSIDIDYDLIKSILQLPKQSLVNDLNKVLHDSIVRYKYFLEESEDVGHEEKHFDFVIHALFLLAETGASDSLDTIFEVLRQEEDYFEFFMGDVLAELVWQVLYKTANSNLEACKNFMFEPGIYTYSKAVVSGMASQIVLHEPGRREEIVAWYRDVFRFFLQVEPDKNILDSSLLGIMVNDVLDFKGVELLPEIEQMYEKNIVDLHSCGDIDDVKKEFKENYDNKREIFSIYTIYDNIKSWGKSSRNEDYEYHSMFEVTKPVHVEKKPGRNDPCPCGSGKKYKKCCMNKEL